MATGNANEPRPGPYGSPDGAWGCGWAWLWFCLFILVIIFAGWGWGGWWGWWGPPYQGVPPQATAPPPANPRPPVTTSGEFLGKTLTVSGRVDQVLSPHAFTLAGSQGNPELLVISKNKTGPAVHKGEAVQVTGTVEKYSESALQTKIGADLSSVPAAEFAGRPAVVASSVAPKTPPG